ncbi:F0F1 ATP synthase subunit delta [Tessaracoccus aquimaris]|uniref:ATP synthase subunit delta n=1 Tax=Tessaracoccus aquimaris TaxID=1332264 RepID=A0A1Q2CMA1_9ACTN|nr:F0F1 ATP synthase subunit delta [Tessaracoccus aquimaris]AQP47226.1 F0F1 ATP synthase subunit delta [Tessaracoccus aquimaris]
MTARDAANAALDSSVEGIATDAATAAELFAVVDLLDGQPMLRRSLSDPSSTPAARAGLAKRLLAGKVSDTAIEVVGSVVQSPWRSANAMVGGLERQGVRIALRASAAGGQLERVEEELYSLARTVDSDPELGAALRSLAYPLEGKRDLVARLISGKVDPVTAQLASRAVRARRRTFPLTIESYLQMAADMAGQKIARITVAQPLDEAQEARLKAALVAQAGGAVTLQIHVDPKVIGGISVAIDDDVYESTVAARLEDARRQLINL